MQVSNQISAIISEISMLKKYTWKMMINDGIRMKGNDSLIITYYLYVKDNRKGVC